MNFIIPFFWGILAAFSALFLELLTVIIFNLKLEEIRNVFFMEITPLLAVSVAIEEALKFWIVYKNFYIEKNKIIARSILIGAGFAAVEIIFILYNEIFSYHPLYLGILEVLAIHSATTGLIGCLLKITENKKYFPLIFLVSFIIHLTYNVMIIYNFRHLFISFFLLLIFVTIIYLARTSDENHLPNKIT